MMPSDAVGAPKICGTPPAARMPSQALRARRSRWALQGVMSLNREATPTMGRSKSSSGKPTARSMARLGAGRRQRGRIGDFLCRVTHVPLVRGEGGSVLPLQAGDPLIEMADAFLGLRRRGNIEDRPRGGLDLPGVPAGVTAQPLGQIVHLPH